MSKPKRVLITGITGMVGSHLADYLLANTDWDIYGMCRWRSPLSNVEHLFNLVNKKERVFFLEADLLDESSLIKTLKDCDPDYIFHLAAQSFPTYSFRAPISTLDTNILGTCRLLEVVRFLSIDPIIHICSSSEVYGRVKLEDLPIREDLGFRPASPYSISKAGTDLLAKFYYEAYDLKILITRMFTHTGPRRGDVFAESSFAKQIAMAEYGLIPPVIEVGNLDSLRAWADVRDCVRAYYQLVTQEPIFGEIYNIGGLHKATVGEMLNTLISFSTISQEIEIRQVQNRVRPLDADLQIPDLSKFKEHYDWKPVITFEQTMSDLLQYWRDRVQDHPQIAGR